MCVCNLLECSFYHLLGQWGARQTIETMSQSMKTIVQVKQQLRLSAQTAVNSLSEPASHSRANQQKKKFKREIAYEFEWIAGAEMFGSNSSQ